MDEEINDCDEESGYDVSPCCANCAHFQSYFDGSHTGYCNVDSNKMDFYGIGIVCDKWEE